ncbi:hypothetical protein GCM10009868_31190 [Terrabacter aerolatus]|uniref:Uncharacterized protein n=1 Tax=Terrabacter aerolatus TaxID=422442 RepID=A0A512CYZ3_9MICO|nr:hypothetical protein [Terrabacter aerolatus]GEO29438.1 hypothetical protein TAE01_12480 [Terrabacter aerolatus]
MPLLVALVTSLLVKASIDPGPYQQLIAQLVGGAVATAYYVAVRVFETYVKPRFGWLLGYAKQPTYDAPAAPSDASPSGAVATEATEGIPEGAPVEVVPAGSVGDGLGDAVSGVADGIFGCDTKTDATYLGRHE